MRRFLSVLASVLVTMCLGMGIATAEHHEEAMDLPNIVPVDTWTCNFVDGKGMDDLKEVNAEWNDWLDDESVTDYFAAIVVPNYYGERLFDVGWLGAWVDGNAMGTGTDLWLTEGSEIGEKYNSVLDCSSHTAYASMNIKQPGEDEDDDKAFVLSFSNCSAKEGKSFEDIMAGVNAWAAHQSENGFQNSTWMMFPIYGESNNDYNYKLVVGHDDHAAFGADFELMGNGGHWVKQSEIMDDLVECDIARVYDAMTIREITPADDDS